MGRILPAPTGGRPIAQNPPRNSPSHVCSATTPRESNAQSGKMASGLVQGQSGRGRAGRAPRRAGMPLQLVLD